MVALRMPVKTQISTCRETQLDLDMCSLPMKGREDHSGCLVNPKVSATLWVWAGSISRVLVEH